MTPTAMRQLLKERGIRLTKSLGQSFLHDANQLRRIVAAAELTKEDRVLEVGPGLGPLTELLVERAGEVLAIEKDARLVEVLKERFEAGRAPGLSPTLPAALNGIGGTSVLRLLHEDALDYLSREERDWSDWKLVANLPYSVASPVLVELAQAPGCPRLMVATLQLEVARRIVARAGDDDYGVLSLLLLLRYEPDGIFKIPADCFFPAPDVESGCVTLVRRERPLLPTAQHAAFEKLVKLGFSQRRKMMLKLLKTVWPEDKLLAVFERLDLSPQIRAEKVTLEQFAKLTEDLTS